MYVYVQNVCSNAEVTSLCVAPWGVGREEQAGCVFLSVCLCVSLLTAHEEFTVLAVQGEISLHFSSRVSEMLCNLHLPLDNIDMHPHMQYVTFTEGCSDGIKKSLIC